MPNQSVDGRRWHLGKYQNPNGFIFIEEVQNCCSIVQALLVLVCASVCVCVFVVGGGGGVTGSEYI